MSFPVHTTARVGSSDDGEPLLDRRALLVIFGAAAGAGIYLEVTRERPAEGARAAAPASSGPAAPLTAESGRTVTRAAVTAAVARLESLLREPAGDDAIPWAVAHGLLAFGPSFTAKSGTPAAQVLVAHATRDAGGWRFPPLVGGQPLETHRHLVLAKLLEAGVDADRSLASRDAGTVTVRDLVADVVASARFDARTDWREAAFTLYVLARTDQEIPTDRLDAIRDAAFAHAARELEPLRAASGAAPDQAFELGMPLRAAKEGRRAIYAHTCGGLHFLGGVLALGAKGGAAAGDDRAGRILEDVVFRWRAERHLYTRSLAQHPGRRLELLVQRLKFHGHLLEVLAEARADGWQPTSIGMDELLGSVAADVLDTLSDLDRDQWWPRLAELRATKRQLYLDLVGDGCHALRGLRLVAERLP